MHSLSKSDGLRSSFFGSSTSGSLCSAASLDWEIASSPSVFHGNTEEKTRTLLSGQMLLDVKEDSIEVKGCTSTLDLHTLQK
ncbi:hypothetical protein FVEN_g12607 [Fusarium venenatum]|nr:hypothetical protein FVEN_g12607 [Fusarium venenatum]